MNSSVLALIAAAVLIVVALILKKRSAGKKSDAPAQGESPVVLAPSAPIPEAQPVEPAPEAEVAPQSPAEEEVVPPAPEESVVEQTEPTVVDEVRVESAAVPVEMPGITMEAASKAEPEGSVPAAEVVPVTESIESEAPEVQPETVCEVVSEESVAEEPETITATPIVAEAEVETVTEAPEPEPAADAGEAAVVAAPEAVEEPAPEQVAGVAEPIAAAAAPEPAPRTAGVADAAASAVGGPVIRLTLEAYSDRLNTLEDRQRSLLEEAITRHDDILRDRLQRELVLMNDKMALLADSYGEEMACYQQVLQVLEQLRGEAGEPAGLDEAIDRLCNGDPEAAEGVLMALSKEPQPFAGRAAYGCGRLAECRVDLQRALALYRQAVGLEPDNPASLQAAGRTARNLYQYKEALPWLESYVHQKKASANGDVLGVALAQRELAYTYVLSGNYQKAGPLYKEAMTALARKLGEDHPEMAISWQQIGELQETLGEYDKAVSLYKKALAILEKKRGAEHPVLANLLAKLAALFMELEMEKEAVPLYERLVRIREKALRPTHPQLAISLNNLAEAYRLQGRYADAETCYQKTMIINETIHGSEHPSVAAVLQELAKLSFSQRRPEEAKRYQERAAAIFQKSVDASEKVSGKEALTLELD